ncbi:hypothetical protein Rctr85_049 [Virus Rctr85]|nr:hypothetical protein Rctr85_049 [Virus Rctr85]
MIDPQRSIIERLGKNGVIVAFRAAIREYGIMRNAAVAWLELDCIQHGHVPWNPAALAETLCAADQQQIFFDENGAIRFRENLSAYVIGSELWARTFRELVEKYAVITTDTDNSPLVAAPRLRSGSAVVGAVVGVLRLYHYNVVWGSHRLPPSSKTYPLSQDLDTYFLTDYQTLKRADPACPVKDIASLPNMAYWVSVPYRPVDVWASALLIPAYTASEAREISEMCDYRPGANALRVRTLQGFQLRREVRPGDRLSLNLEWRYDALRLDYPKIRLEEAT